MLDLIKENLLNVTTLIQEKYGELTKEEIDTFRQNPEELFNLLERKFNVSRDEVEDFISNNVTNHLDNPVEDVAAQGLGLNTSVTSPLEGNIEGLK